MWSEKAGKSDLKFCYKMFETGNEIILAIADKEIVGKTFKDKDSELTIEKSFYGDKPANEEEVKSKIRNSTSINGIGTNTIELLEELGLVKKGDVKIVCGQPHVIVMRV